MRIAVPLFGTRVSPRFDCAMTFLVAGVDEGEIVERSQIAAEGRTPRDRVAWLLALGVDTMICGGIDMHSAQLLDLNGITAYSWVTGEAEDALRSVAEGSLEPGMMMGPGGRCCGRWRFRGGRGRRGRGSQRRGER